MRRTLHACAVIGALSLLMQTASFGASMILNEYNAVKAGSTLKSPNFDPYFGSGPVVGNGGDWMEFVVIEDNLDLRGWSFVTTQSGMPDATIVLPSWDIFASLRSGTIFTIAEDVATDTSYNPVYDPADANAGDWWINYQASFSDGDSTNDNFQVWIYDRNDDLIFGPAGEGVWPISGIGSDEVFKLEANPSASITNDSAFYRDGTSSTFGAANKWSAGTITQDFSQLRSAAAVPEPASILALACGLGGMLFGRRKLK